MKLGVISNWDDRLRPLLQVLGLEERFDSIVISCEVGDSKPSCPGLALARYNKINLSVSQPSPMQFYV